MKIYSPPGADVGLELCIFLPNGKMFYFYDVKVLQDSKDAIHFYYFGQNSGRRKHATFFYNQIAGISTSVEKK